MKNIAARKKTTKEHSRNDGKLDEIKLPVSNSRKHRLSTDNRKLKVSPTSQNNIKFPQKQRSQVILVEGLCDKISKKRPVVCHNTVLNRDKARLHSADMKSEISVE